MTEFKNNRLYSETVEPSVSKIVNSIQKGLVEAPENLVSFYPGDLLTTYVILKSKIIAVLNLGILSDQNINKITDDLEKGLMRAYIWVSSGMKFYEKVTGNSEGNASLSYFLELLEKQVLFPDIPKKYYQAYYLIAMSGIVSFEEDYLRSFGQIEDFGSLEKSKKLYGATIDCLGSLNRAQSAFELGNINFERSLGKLKSNEQQAMFDQIAPTIKAREGLKNSNIKKSIKAVVKWLPLIKEVVAYLAKLESSNRKVKQACGHVAKRHEGINQGTLRNHYKDYLKNPSKYE